MATSQVSLNYFAERRYRPRSQPLPIINWGRGRLNNYESFIGFAAKFCRLNLITPKQFRDFWRGESVAVDCFHFDHEKKIINHIARVLNEPFAVVNTVFWDTRLGWGKLSVDQKTSDLNNKISYCSACLNEGYHGYFHMSDWLRKCPIHLINLTIENLPWGAGTNFDRSVVKLASLLDLNCPGWEISDGNYLSSITIKQLPTLQKFLRWHKKAQLSTTKWSDACLKGLSYKNCDFRTTDEYNFRHLDLLIGRLSWILPIPKQIFELFVVNPLYAQPDVQLYDKTLADEIREILSRYSLTQLLYLYKYANFVKCDFLSFQKAAELAISSINSQHNPKKCMCTWGLHQQDGWYRFEAGVLQDYRSYQCPYQCAVNELHHEWLDLLPGSSIQGVRSLESYGHIAYAAATTGIVTIVGRASGESMYGSELLMMPILKFNWSDQMAIIIEEILTKVVMIHVDELKRWLSEIELGSSPKNRNHFPPSIYLVLHENSNLQLVSWPTGKQQ